MYNEKDLVEYAFDYIVDSDTDIEELHKWDAFSIAEAIGADIEAQLTSIEFTDKQYGELLEMLEKMVKMHEEEIDSKIDQYIEECTNNYEIKAWRFA